MRDAKGGLFEVIVVDEWSRLSRQEPIDFISSVVKPLKDAGILLDCVAEGVQHWDDLAQQILMLVRADKARGESKTRSYRTLTGMAKHARERRILGPAPYGYTTDYEMVHEPGKPPRVVPVRFVPDPKRAHIVRWLFEKYAEGGWGMDDLARELNSRAVEPPARKGGRASATRRRGEPCTRWTHNTVRCILKNPRYTGALTWNRRSRGKFHRLTNGQAVVKPSADDVANEPEEWIVSAEPDHEPLVSQELFDRTQARMKANKGTTPAHGAYLFSGLLTCSHCGQTLAGIPRKGKRVYRCHMYDSAGVVVCGNNAVGEDWLLERVLKVIEDEVLAPGRLESLRAEVRRQDEEESAPAAVDPLKKRFEELEARIAQGNENLAVLPQDRLPGVVAKVREWEQERDRVKAELARRQGGGNLAGLEEAIAECEALLWRLREAVAAGDPLGLREVIRETVARIELSWTRHPYGKRTRYLVSGGVIHLRPPTGKEPLALHGSARDSFQQTEKESLALHGKPCRSTTSGPDPASTQCKRTPLTTASRCRQSTGASRAEIMAISSPTIYWWPRLPVRAWLPRPS
jgi:hypothetical protein